MGLQKVRYCRRKDQWTKYLKKEALKSICPSAGLKGVCHNRLTKFFKFNGKYQLTNPESQQAPSKINQTNRMFHNQIAENKWQRKHAYWRWTEQKAMWARRDTQPLPGIPETIKTRTYKATSKLMEKHSTWRYSLKMSFMNDVEYFLGQGWERSMPCVLYGSWLSGWLLKNT